MTIRFDRYASFGAVLVLLAGYLAVFRPSEAAIAERYAQLDDARALLADRLAADRRAERSRDEERALARWIVRSGLRDDRATATDRFLHVLATTAQADGVRVTAVAAGAPEPAAPAVSPPAALAFDELPLTVSLRGTYVPLMRLVRDLNRPGFAARIAITALANPARTALPSPELRATLHVTLLRLPKPNSGDPA